jgi:TolB-like protein/Tfp pilus assembly protein PilF
MAEPIRSETTGQHRSASTSGETAAAAAALNEAEFTEAVRSALRHYLRTDLLRDNPLLRSQLVAIVVRDAAEPTAPVQALKDLLREHCERIGDAPKLAALRRVLELTWLSPMRSQQVVAESLHLSWSTYRRRLADAMQLLTAQLWEAECALVHPAGQMEPPRRRAGDRVQGEEAALAAETVPIEAVALPVPEADAASSSDVGSALAGEACEAAPHPSAIPALARPRRRKRWIASAMLAAMVLLAAGLYAWAWPRRAAAPVGDVAATARPPSAPAAGAVSLAVLPFLNMGADPSQQYLSDGITEELINRLGRFPHLRVAARTSTFVFRDKPVDVREAAHALGVTNVLEGSVQRSGERLRVRVALVSAKDGYELWATEYEPAARDLLTVEDEIAEAVLRELQPRLSASVLTDLHTRAGLDPAAHDYYLVGLQYLNRRTSTDIAKAIAYFRRAIQADPDYAPAWSAVAEAYTVLRDYNSDAPPDTHYDEALSAAHRAVELDPQLSRPHAVLGLLYQEHWQWRQAEREFKLALQLDPSDAAAHQWYAMHAWFRSDIPGALAEMRRAHDLDPLSPIINSDYGRALLYSGDVEGAIAQYRAAIALEPGFALAHLFLAEAWLAKDRNADAVAETHTAVALTPAPHPASYLAMLGLTRSLNGDRHAAREQLDALESRARRQYVSGVSLALLEWQFGEKDQAFANLDRAVADHDHLMLPVVASQNADWRGDPRFAGLMREMGLASQ